MRNFPRAKVGTAAVVGKSKVRGKDMGGRVRGCAAVLPAIQAWGEVADCPAMSFVFGWYK